MQLEQITFKSVRQSISFVVFLCFSQEDAIWPELASTSFKTAKFEEQLFSLGKLLAEVIVSLLRQLLRLRYCSLLFIFYLEKIY